MKPQQTKIYSSLIGLGYEPANGDSVPYICLQSAGDEFRKITLLARKHRIPVVENRPLCKALIGLKIGSLIPVSLFKAVAIVLCRLERELESRRDRLFAKQEGSLNNSSK